MSSKYTKNNKVHKKESCDKSAADVQKNKPDAKENVVPAVRSTLDRHDQKGSNGWAKQKQSYRERLTVQQKFQLYGLKPVKAIQVMKTAPRETPSTGILKDLKQHQSQHPNRTKKLKQKNLPHNKQQFVELKNIENIPGGCGVVVQDRRLQKISDKRYTERLHEISNRCGFKLINFISAGINLSFQQECCPMPATKDVVPAANDNKNNINENNLAAWEQYTRGIGTKILLQMGYVPGKGLGKELQGILKPVEAQLRRRFGFNTNLHKAEAQLLLEREKKQKRKLAKLKKKERKTLNKLRKTELNMETWSKMNGLERITYKLCRTTWRYVSSNITELLYIFQQVANFAKESSLDDKMTERQQFSKNKKVKALKKKNNSNSNNNNSH